MNFLPFQHKTITATFFDPWFITAAKGICEKRDSEGERAAINFPLMEKKKSSDCPELFR